MKDAKENAKINNIKNVEFITGDTELILDKLINKQKILPNVIMVDPPRKGLDTRTVNNILKIKPNRFVYISCNPATMVRDLAKFESTYEIVKIQPVDMFPWTSHVECVAVLYLKDSIQQPSLLYLKILLVLIKKVKIRLKIKLVTASKYKLYLPIEEEFKKELNLDNYVKKEEEG